MESVSGKGDGGKGKINKISKKLVPEKIFTF